MRLSDFAEPGDRMTDLTTGERYIVPEPDPPKPVLYAAVTHVFRRGPIHPTGDVAGILFDHEGRPIHSHMSSSEAWLWNDLTTSFKDRRELLEAKYPNGYDVVHLGIEAMAEDFAPLYALWDALDPGWRAEGDDDE